MVPTGVSINLLCGCRGPGETHLGKIGLSGPSSGLARSFHPGSASRAGHLATCVFGADGAGFILAGLVETATSGVGPWPRQAASVGEAQMNAPVKLHNLSIDEHLQDPGR